MQWNGTGVYRCHVKNAKTQGHFYTLSSRRAHKNDDKYSTSVTQTLVRILFHAANKSSIRIINVIGTGTRHVHRPNRFRCVRDVEASSAFSDVERQQAGACECRRRRSPVTRVWNRYVLLKSVFFIPSCHPCQWLNERWCRSAHAVRLTYVWSN